MLRRTSSIALSAASLVAMCAAWTIAVKASGTPLLPMPWRVAEGIFELARSGALFRYAVASLFRVTWGFLLAVALGVPTGLALGWYRRADRAFGPFLQMLRPISPLAWTPLAILWLGVGDQPAILIIFLGSFFPLALTTASAVANVPQTHINVARNFGIRGFRLLRTVLYPAVIPQIVIGLRLSAGVAWLVVVAAEMIAVNSGLGFLIVDSRNAGNRYDLVVGGMVVIGLIGFGIDTMMRRLERARRLRWAFASESVAADDGR